MMVDDTISRQAAINETWEEPQYTDPLNVMTEIRERLRALPTAEPQIVRCRDCKYWEETLNGKGYCKDIIGFGRWWKGNDYCSYGEREDG